MTRPRYFGSARRDISINDASGDDRRSCLDRGRCVDPMYSAFPTRGVISSSARRSGRTNAASSGATLDGLREQRELTPETVLGAATVANVRLGPASLARLIGGVWQPAPLLL